MAWHIKRAAASNARRVSTGVNVEVMASNFRHLPGYEDGIPVLSVAKLSPAPAARALAARCGRAQCFLGSASVHVKQADRSRLERSVRFSSCRCKLLFSEQ